MTRLGAERPSLVILAALAGATLTAPALAQKLDRNSYLGKSPPEIVSEKEHWIGKTSSLTLAQRKGKVVWLHFNF